MSDMILTCTEHQEHRSGNVYRVCVYKSCFHGSCAHNQLNTREVNATWSQSIANLYSVFERRASKHQMPTLTNYTNIVMFIIVATCTATPVLFLTPEATLAHPAVIINSAMEDNLPNQLRNNFYKNPSIAAGLAKESWFIDKEMQVIDRETDKIPREKIYRVLHNAGLIRR
ncbi:uncharacterized protein [Temnothorax longispinosus]